MSEAVIAQAKPNPPASVTERWLITIAVMLAAVIEVLDVTIVNVALPDMMGSLGANSEQITWVLTSYIVSAGIFMVLTGVLVNWLGRRKLLLINIFGFGLTSMLCGLSSNLVMIVVFRILQGIFGASLIPLSQVILRDTFPAEDLPKAMAIWGVGIMTGPVLGPTLGGYITEYLNWRWVFYINLPVCILAFFMTARLIKESPIRKQYIDWLGIALMAIGVGTLQLFLDRGNAENWFDSRSIQALFAVCIISLTIFIVRGLSFKRNIINLHNFKDPNFNISCILMMIFCACMFGTIAIQPLMMETLMNYSASTTGLMMAPRGLSSAVGMAIVAQLLNRYDPRWFVAIGLVMAAYGTHIMSGYNLLMGEWPLIEASLYQGFGMGLFFVPLATLAFTTLPYEETDEASGLFSFARSIGTSVGISISSTILSRTGQINWNRLGGHIQSFNPNLHYWLHHQQLTLQDPQAVQRLAMQLGQQSSMLSYVDAYWLMMVFFLAMLPLVFMIKKPQPGSVSMLLH